MICLYNSVYLGPLVDLAIVLLYLLNEGESSDKLVSLLLESGCLLGLLLEPIGFGNDKTVSAATAAENITIARNIKQEIATQYLWPKGMIHGLLLHVTFWINEWGNNFGVNSFF
jgi:hypothetical protein